MYFAGGIYQLNYTINIHEEGNRIEFVVPQEHGTHVACIAAGCFPEAPERNGLAPGCQIVSIKIGHTLLDGSNETGTSLVRAFLYCMKNQVDIVNISYNEPYNWSNGGRVFEAIEIAVKEYGIVVCVAAGNAGPGFSTVGSLPASPYTLGIGALVTADMMKEIYGMSYRHPSQMFNWTSRGPALNGDIGVNICAPGGAIASIPTYTLQNSTLMNGTSMASPNACGAITTILSGLRAKKLPWSAFHVRRALENTAKKLDTSCDARMAHGAGIVQCQEAFNWLVNYAEEMERDVDISVKVGSSGGGIYIRRQPHLSQDSIYTVTVQVSFPKKKMELYQDMPKFHMAVTLTASEEWVRCAECLSLSTGDKAFKVEVRASRLKPGCHFAAVYGFDASKPDKGYVFMVPITVCLPERGTEWSVERAGEPFRPGHAVRRYLTVPQGATWAEWRLEVTDTFEEDAGASSQTKEASSIMNFEYHAMQLADDAQYKRHMFKEATALPVKRLVSACFPISDRLGVLELAISLFWNRAASVSLNWTLDFHGLKPTVPEIVYQEGEAYYRLDVDTGCRSEFWQPSTTLTHLIQPIRPTEFALSALPFPRDTWPDGRITLQLVLQYSFKVDKNATVEVTCPVLLDFLYENEIEGQMWKLYDSNKRLLRCGEARVMRKIDFTAKLTKGEYTIHLQLRHDNRKILESFQDCVLYLRKKLSTPLSFDIVPSYLAALRGAEDKIKPTVLSGGQSTHCFLVPPSLEKLGSKPHGGYVLDGWLYFATARDQPADARRNAGAYKLKYVLSEPGKGKAKGSGATKPQSSVATSKSDVSVGLATTSEEPPSDNKKAEEDKTKDTLEDPILNHQLR
ncbi:hypothetical protein RvY_03915 [Ramazzottius varieornatus]|uniref:Uncharacterized protein n=1 Tax=Ramazzottius varieornatus TaxID=947166 RepID=A0A1D1UT75_RAMVA|nr:hypothetical protein RvY_03915 [Ramazzottius varieornatus]